MSEHEEIKLQYFNGTKWVEAGRFYNEEIAWISLGGDDFNYRTVDSAGNVLTDKSSKLQQCKAKIDAALRESRCDLILSWDVLSEDPNNWHVCLALRNYHPDNQKVNLLYTKEAAGMDGLLIYDGEEVGE